MSELKKPVPLPFAYTFASGAIAGCTELLLLYPLDVVKTRQQLETGKSVNMIQVFKNIIAEEGPRRLYRGILPPLMLEAPKRAVKFAANGSWGSLLTDNGQRPTTQSIAILTGCLAGATESVVVTPFELVKIRMQDKSSTFAGPMDVVKQALKKGGPLALYQGMESTFWRHWWWNGGYFGSIYAVKGLLPKATSKKQELGNNLIAGTVGGFVGTSLNTPYTTHTLQSMLSSLESNSTALANGLTPLSSRSPRRRVLLACTRVSPPRFCGWHPVVVSCCSLSRLCLPCSEDTSVPLTCKSMDCETGMQIHSEQNSYKYHSLRVDTSLSNLSKRRLNWLAVLSTNSSVSCSSSHSISSVQLIPKLVSRPLSRFSLDTSSSRLSTRLNITCTTPSKFQILISLPSFQSLLAASTSSSTTTICPSLPSPHTFARSTSSINAAATSATPLLWSVSFPPCSAKRQAKRVITAGSIRSPWMRRRRYLFRLRSWPKRWASLFFSFWASVRARWREFIC